MTTVATVVVFLIYLVAFGARSTPGITPDEFGYVAQAQYFAGRIPMNMGHTAYYSFGFPLLISPLAWAFPQPDVFYMAVMVVNAALCAAIVPCLLKIARDFGAQTSVVTVAAAAVVSLWPSYFYVAGYAWSEPLFRLLFLGTILAASAVRLRGSAFWTICFAALATSVYATHMRGVAVVGAAGAALAWYWLTGAIKARAALSGFAVLAGGVLAVRAISVFLFAEIWSGGPAQVENGIVEKALSAASFNGVAKGLLVAMGQWWYQVAASATLAMIGVIYVGRRLLDSDRLRVTSGFVLLSIAGVAAASVVQMISADRLDRIMYGRYIDGVSVAVLWLGMIALLTQVQRIAVWLAGSCFLLLALALLLALSEHAQGLRTLVTFNVGGIGALFTPEAKIVEVVGVASVVAVVLVTAAAIVRRPGLIVAVFALLVFSADTTIAKRRQSPRPLDRAHTADVDVIRMHKFGDAYATNAAMKSPWLFHLQYALQDRFKIYHGQPLRPGDVLFATTAPMGQFSCAAQFTPSLYLYVPGPPVAC